jgi:C4-dicarboxylate-specific signal transduction histidine kinase
LAYDQLEIRVAERTAQLTAANERSLLEIIERQRAEEQVRLLQTMTQAISEAEDFNLALGVALHQVCEATDWNFKEAWIPQVDGKALRCSPAYYKSDNKLEKCRKLSASLTFAPGIGLPGRAWLSPQPEWVQDVSMLSNSISLHSEMARKCGLKAGLGIPIIANEQVLAVLVFFMFESRAEDQRLVELVTTVATQLGWVIGRKQAEEEIKQLNQDLQRRTIDLAAANKELEAFSYSVSHDLRAPLRAMNGFSRILIDEYATQLAPEAKRYLQMAQDNAQQMGQVIDDLLSLSRLGRSQLKKQQVAPTAIMYHVLTALRHEQENRDIEI